MDNPSSMKSEYILKELQYGPAFASAGLWGMGIFLANEVVNAVTDSTVPHVRTAGETITLLSEKVAKRLI